MGAGASVMQIIFIFWNLAIDTTQYIQYLQKFNHLWFLSKTEIVRGFFSDFHCSKTESSLRISLQIYEW